MSFEEIREMTFREALFMISELQAIRTERLEAASAVLKRSKDVMPVFDVTGGIYE